MEFLVLRRSVEINKLFNFELTISTTLGKFHIFFRSFIRKILRLSPYVNKKFIFY